jgi:hypothetical protein
MKKVPEAYTQKSAPGYGSEGGTPERIANVEPVLTGLTVEAPGVAAIRPFFQGGVSPEPYRQAFSHAVNSTFGNSGPPCAGPGCDHVVVRRFRRGRPPIFCSRRCSDRARRDPSIPKRAKLKDEQRQCPSCSATFSPGNYRGKRYCSIRCACAARPRLGRGSRMPVHTCAGCAREFRPKQGDRTTYCSRGCYQQTLRDRPSVRVGWAAVGHGATITRGRLTNDAHSEDVTMATTRRLT